MVDSLFPSARAQLLMHPQLLLRSLCAKQTKGPRAATGLAAPWRQGTEIGSNVIVTPTVSVVNWDGKPLIMGYPDNLSGDILFCNPHARNSWRDSLRHLFLDRSFVRRCSKRPTVTGWDDGLTGTNIWNLAEWCERL